MVSYILKGEALFAFGAFAVDSLTPLSWPKEDWGGKRFYALTHYGMIAATIEGVVAAIFFKVIGIPLASLVGLSLATVALGGAFMTKRYFLLHSIEIDTAHLDEIEKRYKADVERLEKDVKQLKGQVDQLHTLNDANEKQMADTQKQLALLTQQLKDTQAQLLILQNNIETLKEIPNTLGTRIEQLAGKINTFAKERKDLNDTLKKSIDEQNNSIQKSNADLKDTLSRLDKENKETNSHLVILGKLIDSLDSVVDSVLKLYQEVEASIEKLKEEIKTWQIDKVVAVLDKEGQDIGASADQISKATSEATAEIAKAHKNQAELEKIIEKSKQTLRGMRNVK